jgi:hypothetical protein
VRRGLRVLAAIAAVYVILVVLLLPPRARVSVAVADGAAAKLAAPAVARGAYHIHTERSDGTGTVEEVAAAAARAGLQFIILTDHGDGMRPPLLPRRHHGVLVLDGVEISTSGGHYVALGLPVGVPTPYRLAGEPRDVVEDVRRMGGFGIAAHPDSPKPELQWSGWDTRFDAIEWLNADTEWRDETRVSLLRSLATYTWRPAETVAALVSHHPRPLLSRWDELAKTRRVVGLAAADAHARIGMRDGVDPYRGRVLAKIPSYDASFKAFAVNVELPAPLNKDATGPGAERDAATILDAIRAGHVYTTLDALAAPAGVVGFEAESGGRRARMGDFLSPDGAGESAGAVAGAGAVEWRAAVGAPAGATLRLVCDGKVAAEAPASALLHHRHAGAPLPAACRLEAGWNDGDRRVTWLVTNPIYLRGGDDSPPRGRTGSHSMGPETAMPGSWSIERDPQTTAAWRSVPAQYSHGPRTTVEFTYQLGRGERAGQYAALVTQELSGIATATHLMVSVTADQPMRLSVQLRRPLDTPGVGERWVRSVYVPARYPTSVNIWFDDMRPVAPARDAHPPLDKVHALLFVVDTEHTPPGASGRFVIDNLRFQR